MVAYKFREDAILTELEAYVNSTYSEHYAHPTLNVQALEGIIAAENGLGFTVGNVQKYAARYGKKGKNPAQHRQDLLKTIHYGMLALYCHDLMQEIEESRSDITGTDSKNTN